MLRRIIIFLIRGVYQRASRRLWPATCRFSPTCSEYTAQAIEKYGFIKGGWKAVCRVARCNPWNPGGYDPLR